MKTQAGDQSKDDVDQIAQTLTVFCVSSMDYKKITHEVEAPQVSCSVCVIGLSWADKVGWNASPIFFQLIITIRK